MLFGRISKLLLLVVIGAFALSTQVRADAFDWRVAAQPSICGPITTTGPATFVRSGRGVVMVVKNWPPPYAKSAKIMFIGNKAAGPNISMTAAEVASKGDTAAYDVRGASASIFASDMSIFSEVYVQIGKIGFPEQIIGPSIPPCQG
jgi:hypothetical protein